MQNINPKAIKKHDKQRLIDMESGLVVIGGKRGGAK